MKGFLEFYLYATGGYGIAQALHMLYINQKAKGKLSLDAADVFFWSVSTLSWPVLCSASLCTLLYNSITGQSWKWSLSTALKKQ